MGRPIKARTLRLCKEYRDKISRGEKERDVIADLSAAYDIQRPAVFKALRSGGVLPPYAPKQDGSRGRPTGGGQAGYTAERTETAHRVHERTIANVAQLRRATSEPCGRCGVRADVGCKHQAPEGPPPLPLVARPEPIDHRRRMATGQGLSFHHGRMSERAQRIRAGLERLW